MPAIGPLMHRAACKGGRGLQQPARSPTMTGGSIATIVLRMWCKQRTCLQLSSADRAALDPSSSRGPAPLGALAKGSAAMT